MRDFEIGMLCCVIGIIFVLSGLVWTVDELSLNCKGITDGSCTYVPVIPLCLIGTGTASVLIGAYLMTKEENSTVSGYVLSIGIPITLLIAQIVPIDYFIIVYLKLNPPELVGGLDFAIVLLNLPIIFRILDRYWNSSYVSTKRNRWEQAQIDKKDNKLVYSRDADYYKRSDFMSDFKCPIR